MSDSSNNNSKPSMRVTKKNAKSAKPAKSVAKSSAKSTAKSTKSTAKSTKKSANTRKLKKGMMVGRTRVGPALKKVLGITKLRNKNEIARNINASRKLFKERMGHSYENSPNSLDPAGLTKAQQKVLEKKILDRAYRRIGRKVGNRNETGKIRGIEMNEGAKKLVKKFVEEKSYSFGSGNELELVARLGAYNVARAIGVRAPEIKARMKKEAEEAAKRVKAEKEETAKKTKAEKEVAAKEYKQRKELIKADEERLKEAINAAKKEVKRQLKALLKGNDKEVSVKDVEQLARLVGQGVVISAEEHHHLKKHVMDERAKEIIGRLMDQADSGSLDHCAACDIINYVKHI